jgi:NADPH-dependent ferric siderophore reductase
MTPLPLGPRDVERLTLDTQPWLSCDDCFDLVDAYVEQLLTGDLTAQPAMRAHLRGCPACAEEAATLAVLAAEDAGQDPTAALEIIGR